MESLAKSYKKNNFLHHAYILVGEADLLLKELNSFFEKELGVRVRGNPDYQYQEFETFGIDEARALSLAQSRKSYTSGKKIFAFSFQGITTEAQNALLKVLEEPTKDTHFFLITDSTQRFLPTLLSRVQIIESNKSLDKRKDGQDFVNLPMVERLAVALRIGEEKNKKEAKKLLESIEVYLGESIRGGNASLEIVYALEEVMSAKKYLGDRAPSVKMLLEHIALIV
ncbi:MAG: hypothetical protein A2741_02760 [Candidatus Zambryskibacteria bacterium RIFCSPHIGHO2_01_FULL_43_27]|uniref:DNA polymerase III subunit delta n=1 Tax=Candidatus Zambryskibacteria bacterium RIFCSPLOWO2_01_FULL_43_17 TaxID=1802760 RepID=A0A1G2U0I5_9BACT|nr:MAG: hypothetical protein A2741_02760 [Candidatus Zambryskibacteria bacterium RIFCSPHIGHO2_01_FULL_43_27]OHB00578.1 MAG: hypothetical protein A3E93_03135 [Candidatus Zambryskibacteria bacterium RIFCSPHIGHO2_12_FULL_43_12b]OHB03014.1 MAG: hypothetical protein A2920_03000 [Candidatus Zambryskibacteria bacterium RIFCSPLOWO2_01_FULL_43_17]